MNNLQDISYEPQYHALCGFTENDIRTSFITYINLIASQKGITSSFIFKILIVI